MTIRALVLVAAFAAVVVPVADPTAAAPRDRADLERRLDAWAKPLVDAGHLAGQLLVSERGVVIAERAWGMANREAHAPVTPATLFNIASVTKPMTGTIAQQLITFNSASHVELESGRRPKPLLWTDERVRRWRETGEMPGPVMVWTPQQFGTFIVRTVRERDPMVMDTIRRRLYAYDHRIIVNQVSTLTEVRDRQLWMERVANSVLKVLAGIALLLTVVGIFSVLAYTVDRRLGEFGVRMALGATKRDLVGLVMRRGTVLSGASPGATAAARPHSFPHPLRPCTFANGHPTNARANACSRSARARFPTRNCWRSSSARACADAMP